MKIVLFPKPSLADIPASLRSLADKLDSGEIPASIHCAVVSETSDGEVNVYGYGNVESLKGEIGLLQLAILKLASL